jgi:Xaa-Pro aminopeptidase
MDLMATKFRKATSPHHFVGLSFPTIAGADEHGAIVHYRASRSDPTFKVGTIGKDTMLLLDSGAQYLDGTTDVTRTVHLGTPTAFQKEAFTRVLQGHIAMDEAVFPEGTPGFVLDVLARKSLWSAQMDYAHGTGHGVGAALNVHEGPQGVSPRYANYNPLKSGMVISNEPGFYYSPATTTPSTMSTTATTSNADDDKDKRVGKGFGIRIETLLQIVPVDKALAATPAAPQTTTTTGFLKFERLTMIPIQKHLIDFALLSPHEVEWLNAYHAQVREKVAPLLEEEAGDHPRALEWLYEWTAPVGEVTK